MSAWDNYDNWLLKGSGVDDDMPEIFQTEKFEYYSLDDTVANDFDDLIEKAIKDSSVYDTIGDNLEEYAEYLLDNTDFLHGSEVECLEEQAEMRQDAKEEKAERQYQEWKDEGRR